MRADTLGEEYTPEAIVESIKHIQNALAVAQRFAKYKAPMQTVVNMTPKSTEGNVITEEEFLSMTAEPTLQKSKSIAPEKEEIKDGWASIRGMRDCTDIIADLESVGIHSVGEFTAFNITYSGKESELTSKLSTLKRKITALDTLITKMKHLKELSSIYKEYQGLSGFKQSRFKKKNAEVIDDYEQTDSYIKSHIRAYKSDGKMPTVRELTNYSNDMKIKYNSTAQEYRELAEIHAVVGKYSRAIRQYLNQQTNKRATEQSRERKLNKQRGNSALE